MDATLRHEDGKATTKSAKLNAKRPNLKPPLRPLNSQVTVSETEDHDNDLEFFNRDQPPLDLTGHDGSAFTVAKDINLTSPILIDILAEKPEVPNGNSVHSSSGTHAGGGMVQPTVAPMPQTGAWEEW